MGLFRSQRYADGDRIEVAGAPVVLRVSARASRVSLRLDAARREIIATAPAPRLLAEAVAFAGARAGWIAAVLADLPARTPIAPGAVIEVLGQTQAAHTLCSGLPAALKEDYVQPGVGHYGVFNGRRFREEIYPRVRDFIAAHDLA